MDGIDAFRLVAAGGGGARTHRRSRAVLTDAAIAAVVAVGLVAQPASAATGDSSIQVSTSSVDGGTVTTASGGSATSKQLWLAGQATDPSTIVTPDYTISNSWLYSSGSANMSGSYSSVSGKTDADVTSGWEQYADFINSSTSAYWWGLNPVNAQQMSADMKWGVSGLDVSVSLPPGIGFSRSGSSVTWAPGSVYNTWSVSMTRSASVHFATPFTFYSEYFYTDVSVLIGNHWYYVAGN